MTAALLPIQRPRQAKLLALDSGGNIRHLVRSRVVDLFRRGDLVIANDAATLPASLSGEHLRTGRFIEVRLAARARSQPIVPVAAMQLFLGREISACVLKIGQSLRN